MRRRFEKGRTAKADHGLRQMRRIWEGAFIVDRVSNEEARTPCKEPNSPTFTCRIDAVSKRFQMVGFKGSTQEKSPFEIFRFG
jgi:hypothetical protein